MQKDAKRLERQWRNLHQQQRCENVQQPEKIVTQKEDRKPHGKYHHGGTEGSSEPVSSVKSKDKKFGSGLYQEPKAELL